MDMREAFEVWAKTYDINPSLCGYCEEEDGEWYYDEFHVQRSWMGWKAALQSQPAIGSGAEPVDQWKLHCLEYIGQDDPEAIDSDDYEIYLEDDEGRSGTATVSISELCKWAAERLRTHPAPTAQDSLPNEHGSNRYGLDMAYFRNLINRELNHSRGLYDYKPSELARVFARMAAAADCDVLKEPEFQAAQDSKVTEGWLREKISKHTLTAGECPPQSRVVLVSALDRLLSAAPSLAEKPDHTEQPLAMVADKPQWRYVAECVPPEGIDLLVFDKGNHAGPWIARWNNLLSRFSVAQPCDVKSLNLQCQWSFIDYSGLQRPQPPAEGEQ